jgi:hypothetical protein
MQEKKFRQEKSVLGSDSGSLTGYPNSSISGGSRLGTGIRGLFCKVAGCFPLARSAKVSSRLSLIGGGIASSSSLVMPFSISDIVLLFALQKVKKLRKVS